MPGPECRPPYHARRKEFLVRSRTAVANALSVAGTSEWRPLSPRVAVRDRVDRCLGRQLISRCYPLLFRCFRSGDGDCNSRRRWRTGGQRGCGINRGHPMLWISGLSQSHSIRHVGVRNNGGFCAAGSQYFGSRRRTAAVQWYGRIDCIKSPGVKHQLIGRLQPVNAISHQFRDGDRGGVASQRPNAGVAASVCTDGVIKFPWAWQQDSKVWGENGVLRCIRCVMHFDAAGAHAEHEIVAALGGSHRSRGSRTDPDFSAASNSQALSPKSFWRGPSGAASSITIFRLSGKSRGKPPPMTTAGPPSFKELSRARRFR